MDSRTTITPEVVTFADDCHSVFTIQVTLPGVKREEIKLELHDDALNLAAPGDEFDYVVTLSFCCPVNPRTATTSYEKDILKLEVEFRDPLECAIKVDTD